MPVAIRAKKRSYAGYIGTLGVVEDAPANTAAPEIQGTPRPGSLVIVSVGEWENMPAPVFTYQWKVAGVNVLDETKERYRILEADAGKAITVAVTATNDGGATSVTSAVVTAWAAPTNSVAPAITGTAKVGETLTASTGTWTGAPAPDYTYTWAANSVVIEGEAGSTYVPVTGDLTKTITVTVTATNVMGVESKTSAATAAVTGA